MHEGQGQLSVMSERDTSDTTPSKHTLRGLHLARQALHNTSLESDIERSQAATSREATLANVDDGCPAPSPDVSLGAEGTTSQTVDFSKGVDEVMTSEEFDKNLREIAVDVKALRALYVCIDDVGEAEGHAVGSCHSDTSSADSAMVLVSGSAPAEVGTGIIGQKVRCRAVVIADICWAQVIGVICWGQVVIAVFCWRQVVCALIFWGQVVLADFCSGSDCVRSII